MKHYFNLAQLQRKYQLGLTDDNLIKYYRKWIIILDRLVGPNLCNEIADTEFVSEHASNIYYGSTGGINQNVEVPFI